MKPLRLLVVLTVLFSASAGPTALAQDATPASGGNDLLGGNAIERLPRAREGELAVVVAADISYINANDGYLPIVVQNNTDRPLARIDVVGTVRDPDGSILATKDVFNIEPGVLLPGAYGVGLIALEIGSSVIPDDAIIEFLYDATEVTDWEDFDGVLEVTSAEVIDNRITGTIQNPRDVEVTGPISLEALCLDEESAIIHRASEFFGMNTIHPEAEVPYQITLSPSSAVACPYFLVAAGGF